MPNDWLKHVETIPAGYSEVIYLEKKYSLTRTAFNFGKSIKIYARELGGNHFISFNVYYTSGSVLLKPCEMPELEVIDFLQNFRAC